MSGGLAPVCEGEEKKRRAFWPPSSRVGSTLPAAGWGRMRAHTWRTRKRGGNRGVDRAPRGVTFARVILSNALSPALSAARRSLLIASLCLGLTVPSLAQEISITDAQARTIGRRIWQNECSGTVSGLTAWNTGEEFPSLGINHYIWYPRGRSGPFEESFPGLLKFLAARGVTVPDWLRAVRGADCPWSTRAEFQAEFNGSRLSGLRALLSQPEVIALQARYSADRLAAALPKMLDAVSSADRENVRRQFYRVANSPNGVYALVDYVNFKGEGVSPTERYGSRGWGLLQVLAGMRGSDPGAGATREFADSASAVLAERVKNSPPERNEARWLPGWTSRVRGYGASKE